MSLRKIFFGVIVFFSVAVLFSSNLFAQNTATKPIVTVLKIQGAIGPAVQDYVTKGIAQSEKMQAKAIVLEIDTPGGLSTSMRGIIKSILSSSVPVLSYVSPSGARAASAGTYILYASHIAAMAPGTHLGAATPVTIATPMQTGQKNGKNKKAKAKNASQMKMINDAKAYMRALAQLRHRNVKWGVRAVTHAASLSATEALKRNVINVIATSIPDLLQQVNGKTVLVRHVKKKIDTANVRIVNIQPSTMTKILHVITDPSVAYILLMIGVYGLFFEFMNPGYVLPGVTGAICLFLALYAFQLLPINYAGLMLIFAGIIFMVSEAFVPSFGVLGFGGIIAFVVGSFLLMDKDVPGFSLPWEVIFGVTISAGVFLIGVIQLFIRSRRRRVVSGLEMMPDKTGVIEKDGKHFWVTVDGERWHVASEQPLHDKQEVVVVRADGLTLIVKAKQYRDC